MMIVLFEDTSVEQLAPVALTRHVSQLLVGAFTLGERARHAFGDAPITLHGRRHIVRFHGAKGERVARPDGGALFVNARALVTRELAAVLTEGGEWIVRQGTDIVAARLDASTLQRLEWDSDALDFARLDDVDTRELAGVTMYAWLWDLVGDNGARITEDAAAIGAGIHGTVMSGAILVDESSISIGEGAVVRAGAILDATNGPIVIDRDVEVMPAAVIVGPCYIGRGSRVKIGAKIYEQTSIGPLCKVGGEIENSIVLGYSNKQHDGFLGHSYLGAWVNLGADTNTSDLKNNYGPIRVTIGGAEIDTGRMLLGALIGDHSKTGINTMLNTGTVVGVAANIFGGGFPSKSIPSFAWGGADGFETFRIDRAIELAGIVMARRSVPFDAADEQLLKWIAAHEPLPASHEPS